MFNSLATRIQIFTYLIIIYALLMIPSRIADKISNSQICR